MYQTMNQGMNLESLRNKWIGYCNQQLDVLRRHLKVGYVNQPVMDMLYTVATYHVAVLLLDNMRTGVATTDHQIMSSIQRLLPGTSYNLFITNVNMSEVMRRAQELLQEGLKMYNNQYNGYEYNGMPNMMGSVQPAPMNPMAMQQMQWQQQQMMNNQMAMGNAGMQPNNMANIVQGPNPYQPTASSSQVYNNAPQELLDRQVQQAQQARQPVANNQQNQPVQAQPVPTPQPVKSNSKPTQGWLTARGVRVVNGEALGKEEVPTHLQYSTITLEHDGALSVNKLIEHLYFKEAKPDNVWLKVKVSHYIKRFLSSSKASSLENTYCPRVTAKMNLLLSDLKGKPTIDNFIMDKLELSKNLIEPIQSIKDRETFTRALEVFTREVDNELSQIAVTHGSGLAQVTYKPEYDTMVIKSDEMIARLSTLTVRPLKDAIQVSKYSYSGLYDALKELFNGLEPGTMFHPLILVGTEGYVELMIYSNPDLARSEVFKLAVIDTTLFE